MKVCSLCSETLDECMFRKWRTYCKTCETAKCREYYKKNKKSQIERIAKYQKNNIDKINKRRREKYEETKEAKIKAAKKWKEKNPEKVREAKRKHSIKYREKISARVKKWREENPEKLRSARARRKAKIRNASGDVASSDIKFIFKAQKGKCVSCMSDLNKTSYHIDHRIPLAKGGMHTKSNIDLLCPSCNLRKGAKHPVKFMQELGYLL